MLAFAAIGADVALHALGLGRNAARLILWVISSPIMWKLLSDRADYLGLDRKWALAGFVPPIGLFVGVIMYFQEPVEKRAE